MCDCENKTLNLQTINIYLLMSQYKKKSEDSVVVLSNGVYFELRGDVSQELLAYGYEELGLTDYIEKTIKDESKKAVKIKKSSKSSDSKE
tara:strand:- start:16 stop:285 length:270 start_codon:yes stop_codon:yes gene_type:complete